MNSSVKICCMYYAGTCDIVNLPDGKVWEDVKNYYVRWGSVFITWNDNTTSEIFIEPDTTNMIDWKRPLETGIWAIDENGYDTGEEL